MYYYPLAMVLTHTHTQQNIFLKPKSLIHKEPHPKSVHVKFSKEIMCKYIKLEEIGLKAYSLKIRVIEMF